MQTNTESSQIKRGVGLIGSTEPRIHTPLLKGNSKAQEVADLAEKNRFTFNPMATICIR